MSATIIVIGETLSAKLLRFALGNEFEIIQCSSEEEAKAYEENLRISERTGSNRKSHLGFLYGVEPVGFPSISFKQSPSKQQRREWRKNQK